MYALFMGFSKPANPYVQEESLMYNFKRRRQQTTGSNKWSFGAAPYRVTSSRPAQRRTNHGRKWMCDENEDFKRVQSYGGSGNSIRNQSGIIAGRGYQCFNMTTKASCHLDHLMLPTDSEHTRQHAPLTEIMMNCRPVFNNVLQNIPEHRSGHFECSPTTVNEQQPSDLFYYTGDASNINLKCFDVSPTKLSLFSKDSNSSQFSANPNSTNDFLKFSGRNYYCLEEHRRKSLDFLNVSSHPKEKPWGELYRDQVRMAKEEPRVGPYPETPESSGGRISSPECISQRMSLLNEEFGDLSDDALQISPLQVNSSQKFLLSDNTSSNFNSPPLPLEYEERSNFFQVQNRTNQHLKMLFCPQKLEPYLTDPDEEYAKMSANSEPVAILPHVNFPFSP